MTEIFQADCEADTCWPGWGEVPEDLGAIVPGYSLWFYPPVLTVLSTYYLVYFRGHIVVSFSVLGPCELATASDDMCHGICMLLAQPAWCGRSGVPLPWC